MVKIENSKCRYLFVDAKDVVNYPHKDWKNYNRCDKPFISLDEIFNYYDIPEEYRKFIIRKNPLLSKYDCQEYFTKVPFDYTGYTRFKKDDNPKIITGRAVLNYLSNIIEFNTPMEYKEYEEVVNFAFGLIDEEILFKYETAISTICNLYYDYDSVNLLNKYRKVKKK